MNKSKKTSPINNLESVQYIFCVECENTVERKGRTQIEDSSVQMKLMEPFYKVKREKPINISFNVDENGVFSYSDPFCKHCHSHKVTKHGYNKVNMKIIVIFLMKLRSDLLKFVKSVGIHSVN